MQAQPLSAPRPSVFEHSAHANNYDHMAPVVRVGAVQLAGSPDELHEKIVAYLERPTLDRDGRCRIVEQQFGRLDGGSAARLVDQVMAVALKQGSGHGSTR